MFKRTLGPSLATVIVVFVIALSLGFVAVSANEEAGTALMDFLRNEIFADVGDGGSFALFAKIFLNNLEACVLLFLGGASLGLMTLLIISLNGMVIGGVIGIVGTERGLLFMAAAILPHGIFEIPAFIISGALGLSLAHALWDEFKGMGDAATAGGHLGRTFLRFVVPLVIVAAAIEVFITPQVISLIAVGST
ncbi:MAG: stage II sporulation protein M [Methanomicrobiales archaeon]|nr:stage II sporulation protein M [Methanomicrobiales archaeon]